MLYFWRTQWSVRALVFLVFSGLACGMLLCFYFTLCCIRGARAMRVALPQSFRAYPTMGNLRYTHAALGCSFVYRISHSRLRFSHRCCAAIAGATTHICGGLMNACVYERSQIGRCYCASFASVCQATSATIMLCSNLGEQFLRLRASRMLSSSVASGVCR